METEKLVKKALECKKRLEAVKAEQARLEGMKEAKEQEYANLEKKCQEEHGCSLGELPVRLSKLSEKLEGIVQKTNQLLDEAGA